MERSVLVKAAGCGRPVFADVAAEPLVVFRIDLNRALQPFSRAGGETLFARACDERADDFATLAIKPYGLEPAGILPEREFKRRCPL